MINFYQTHFINEKTKAQEHCGWLFEALNKLHGREKTTAYIHGQENPKMGTAYKRYISLYFKYLFFCGMWVETFPRDK